MDSENRTFRSPRERRLTEQLLLYWNTKRGERKYPAMPEIKPEEIPELWPKCFLVAVKATEGKPEHNYTYIGTIVSAMFGGDYASASVLPLADNLAPQYYMVMQAQKPMVQETQFTNLRGQEVKYRQILLPLGSDGTAVDYVLGGISSNLTS